MLKVAPPSNTLHANALEAKMQPAVPLNGRRCMARSLQQLTSVLSEFCAKAPVVAQVAEHDHDSNGPNRTDSVRLIRCLNAQTDIYAAPNMFNDFDRSGCWTRTQTLGLIPTHPQETNTGSHARRPASA